MAKKVIKALAVNPSKKPPLEVEERLTREEKIRVIQWLVELRSTREIAALVKQEFGKDISSVAVWKYRHSKKWKDLIDRCRTHFERNISKIPIANKVDRLRYLQKVVEEGFKWNLKKVNDDGSEVYEQNLNAVAKAAQLAKEEIEPSRGKPNDGIKIVNIIYGYRSKPRSLSGPIRNGQERATQSS